MELDTVSTPETQTLVTNKANPWDAAYSEYALDKTPENLSKVVKTLRPTISYSLGSLNAANDPLLRNKAKVYAVKAIQQYDPASGASLHTWVANNLKQLGRYKRLSQQPVKVPERTQLDAYTIYKGEQELLDKLGREPDVAELGDYIHMSPKKIQKVRSSFKKMTTEGAVGDALTTSNNSEVDYTSEALDYYYRDADYIDRKILEYKTGYGGTEILPSNVIAVRLGLEPYQLTRRSIKMTTAIQEIEDNLNSV